MSMSYDDCQDILVEEKQEEVRQRLLGPIGQRPQEGGPRLPLRELARNCILTKVAELLDNAELVEGYSQDGEHGETYHNESGWFIDYEWMGELEELLDDLKTIEKEGW